MAKYGMIFNENMKNFQPERRITVTNDIGLVVSARGHDIEFDPYETRKIILGLIEAGLIRVTPT